MVHHARTTVIGITMVDTTGGEVMVVRYSDTTAGGNQKCGTQLDEAVAARGATRFKTVSANSIGDTKSASYKLA